MTGDEIRELMGLAEKASKQYPLKKEEEPEHTQYDCPTCGDGSVDGLNYYTGCAAGVQVFGIGKDLTVMKDYILKANPTTIHGLCEEVLRMREAVGKIAQKTKPEPVKIWSEHSAGVYSEGVREVFTEEANIARAALYPDRDTKE